MRTLGELAEALGLEFRGDPQLVLRGLASLQHAAGDHLAFINDKRYLTALTTTSAGAVILKPEWLERWSGACLLTDAPYLAFAKASHLFDNRPRTLPGIHATALVDASARLGTGVSIGPHVVVSAGASIGDGAVLDAGAYVGHGVCVGAGSRLYPGVVLYHDVSIGADCIVHANTVIGADGFGFAPSATGWQKIVQLAAVRIGDRCEIGAGTTIDRGALEDTVIGDNVIIDNQVHIAHGVQVGDGSAIAASVGIAGSSRIGKRCLLAGQVGIADHIEIADDVHLAGQARVSTSINEPGHYASGTPAQPFREWSRNAVRFTQLDQLAKRVRELEQALAGRAPGHNEESTS